MDDKEQSVSNCYVFKSRLQEYAQKAGLTTPIYHTTKEGPPHQPVFRSTVVLNNEITYHSLTGFWNRKASEQSAAEVALIEIAKTGTTDKSVSHPVHETGLCKNLLQEYAQKMNYAMPSYVCTNENKGRESPFSCSVDIGGIKYSGAAAKTKKEAELKAAKTALLAIQMSTPEPGGNSKIPSSESIYTVVPTKRKIPERPIVETEDNVKTNKKKRSRLQKRRSKKVQKTSHILEVKTDNPSVGEVKESNRESISGELKVLKSNGDSLLGASNGEVDVLKSNKESLMGEVNDLKSNGESFLGEVKDLKSNGESLLGKVKNLKSNKETVLGEVKDSKSNGEIVLGEVNDAKSNRESVLGEDKDLKSNRKSVSDEVQSLVSE